ncbi:MAG: hypothetical protein ACHQNA_13625, partial [Acidimicrobiales bacterium]
MKRVLAIGATLGIVLSMNLVGLTSAHVPSVSLTCDGGAVVHLTLYNTQHANSVVVTLDGTKVADEADFGASFSYTNNNLDPLIGHTLHAVVVAWDDPQST